MFSCSLHIPVVEFSTSVLAANLKLNGSRLAPGTSFWSALSNGPVTAAIDADEFVLSTRTLTMGIVLVRLV